jgi:TetR/AcrR family transcriptional repressor of mexJK operon
MPARVVAPRESVPERAPRPKTRPVLGTAAAKGPSGPRAEANRAAILAAARTCFVDEGFDASLDQVAEMAVVSKVTVYNHFGSKESLFLAVIDEALSEALEPSLTLARGLVDAEDLRTALQALCRSWVAGVGSRQMVRLRNAVLGELRRLPNLASEWSRRGPERFNPILGSAFGRLTQAGRLSIPDIDLAVVQLSGLVLSPSLVYGSYGKPPSPRRRNQLIASSVDMFLAFYGYDGD